MQGATHRRGRQPNLSGSEYLYGQPLYPAAPLSWLAPLWSFVCGATASGNWTWTGGSLLRLLLGLLLAGPLLGLAWGASTKTRWRERLANDPSDHTAQSPALALPYTLPNSVSHGFAQWLATILSRWQQAKPYLGRPLLQIVVSTVFALTVAAQLGRDCLVLTLVGLCIAYAASLKQERWSNHLAISTLMPLLFTWLLGHAAYAALRLASVMAALSFAVAFCGYLALHKAFKPPRRKAVRPRPGRAMEILAWQVAPQVVVATSLVVIKQPVAAATLALLGTLQFLLLPLLETQAGRERYFGTVQFPLAVSMFLAALALGYGQ